MRRGFTLIELLVVIAIIAILIGLLLPAVQQVRQAAARVACQNNLKQIGLACHNYHDSQKHLPPGYLAQGTYPDPSPGWGWGTFILPYLEQGNLYNQLDLTRSVPASPAIQTIVKTYICPADQTPLAPFPVTSATGVYIASAAPSSYAATVGQDANDVADLSGDGVFYRNSQVRLTDITDGTSQTVMIGDRAWSQTSGIWAGVIPDAVTRPGPRNPWPNATGPAQALTLVHNNWINIQTDADGGLDDFSSSHMTGVNLVFADGSVHFVRNITADGVERRDFWALGTRAGGEVIKSLEY